MEKNGIVVALAGNPNSGKTSLFNHITGSRQRVGNYAGVTVEKKEGTVRVDDEQVTFLDIPGIYSLSPNSPEEFIALSEIVSSEVSGIIIVIDTTRLERNLYIAAQILETGKPAIIALNMFDEFEATGRKLDIKHLSELLGVPCIKTVGSRGKGVTELMSASLKAVKGEIVPSEKFPRYSHEMEHAIDKVSELIKGKTPYNIRWTAINLLHFGESFLTRINGITLTEKDFEIIKATLAKLESLEGSDINTIVASGRYGFSAGIIAECLVESASEKKTLTEKIDSVLTHRFFGIPIFLGVLWFIFQMTFTAGELPGIMIENIFDFLKHNATEIIPTGFFQSLIVDGILSGVGGVLVFLPNILLLFFFISILEDTGYMARAAFIMDRVMHAVGLHGKSFIPMLVGFGCSVPAIMATRTLEHRRDRLITMFIIPFMSCGARLPVYILLVGAFFPPGKAGTVIFSIYIIGIIMAFLIAKIISSFSSCSAPFVMELPTYRIPTARSVLLHIWERAWMYIKKAGTILLGFSILMWILMTYPKMPESHEGEAGQQEALSYSLAGRFGKLIEPAIQPLGLDWRIGVALTAGFSAKEVVVSTLATIYSIDYNEEGSSSKSLQNAIRNDKSLNAVKAYGLMLFILLYVPCMAVLGVLKREAGGWKWVFLMVIFTVSVAWIVSFSFIKIAGYFF